MHRTACIVSIGLVLVALPASVLGAPDTWDSRLNQICGLFLQDVTTSVPNGSFYWRLTSGAFEDESQSGFNHHVYYKCLDVNGSPIVNQKVWASWSYTNETNFVFQFTKDAADGYWGNYAMSANCGPGGCNWPYNAYVDTTSGLSDKVWGMGMTNPNGTGCGAHVNFRLTWKWTQKVGASGTPTITRSSASLSPSTSVGSSPANQSFTVQNTGTGSLSYTISDNVTWLSLTPTTGTSTGEADTITVQYSTGSLGVGSYNATITITDPNATNNPQTIPVTLTVNSGGGGGGGSNLLANADFEGTTYNNPDAEHKTPTSWNKFVISGTPKHSVTWFGSAAHSPNFNIDYWEVNWTAGLYQRITTATSGLLYTGNVWVKGAGNTYWVGVDPTGGTDAASANVQWSSATSGSSSWQQVSKSATASGTAVTIFLKGQRPTSGGTNGAWDDASLTGPAGLPTIARSPAALNPSVQQGGNATSQSFTVQNTGTGTLSYSITDDASWLSQTPSSGTSTGEADTITVNYATSSLTPGTYNATITISDPASSNNPQTVAVTLTVTVPPAIDRSPATLSPSCTQGTNASNQTFSVQNSGGGTLSYSITDDASWLSVSPSSGTSTGEQDTMTVNYTTSGLTAGTYNATISISDGGASNSPQTIAVTLTVNPAAQPTITRSPATLNPSVVESSNASNQTFTVQNTGSGTLSYSISDNVTWLVVSPTSGTSTGEVDTLTVSYATSALAIGTYNGTITISDPNATNNPQTIGVTLTVSKKTVTDNLEGVPAWDSTFDAGWGGAATWSSVTGGQSGNCLQASRSNTGSSSKVKWYTLSANQSYTVHIWIKCPSATTTYWRECAFKLGQQTASNFDSSAGSWAMIKKFENVAGSNGNSDTWTEYTATFNSGANTQISVGFKTGNSSGTAPTIKWDALQIN